MLKIHILLSSVFISFIAHSQPSQENPLLVSLERGACKGPCPVYSVTVFKDGNVVFNGEQYTKMMGRHEYKISPESVNAIQQELKRIRFFFTVPLFLYQG